VAAVAPSYKGFRYPAEIISHCVWLYHRFPLSFREVEEMRMERGVVVTDKIIRQWCRKFGQTYASGLRCRRPRPGDKWHLDEVFIKIHGKTHYLCRVVGRCCIDRCAGRFSCGGAVDQRAHASSVKTAKSRCRGSTSTPSS
jgi:transposase-like protein